MKIANECVFFFCKIVRDFCSIEREDTMVSDNGKVYRRGQRYHDRWWLHWWLSCDMHSWIYWRKQTHMLPLIYGHGNGTVVFCVKGRPIWRRLWAQHGNVGQGQEKMSWPPHFRGNESIHFLRQEIIQRNNWKLVSTYFPVQSSGQKPQHKYCSLSCLT